MEIFSDKLSSNKNFLRNALITVYILVVLGISATARAEMTILPIFVSHGQVHTKDFTGEIAMTVDSKFYLVVSNDEFYELKANIDLTEYNGLLVKVEGYELKQKVGPVLQTASLDPLPEGNEHLGAPLLVVFGISEIVR